MIGAHKYSLRPKISAFDLVQLCTKVVLNDTYFRTRKYQYATKVVLNDTYFRTREY